MEPLNQSAPLAETQGASRPDLVLVESVSEYQRIFKPILDVILGTVMLLLLSPLIFISMAMVLLSMGMPIIYRQNRIGKDGQPFELLKLRTMIPDRRNADEPFHGPERRVIHKSQDDPRVPPMGKVLRALRLDELPQLWNVMRGDMSLVGPRPELPEIVNDYQSWQHRRHTVKPGLTGLWQVSAPDGRLMHECTELDLKYIEDVSLKTDLSIIARTPIVIFRRDGY